MLWFNKAQVEENKTFTDVLQRLANVESKLKGLEIENTDLRNKVLRKIQKLPEPDKEINDNPMEGKVMKPFSPFMQ